MSVFGDWAEKYFDLGINVLPIETNKQPPKGFVYKHWLSEKQTQSDMDSLIKIYGRMPGIAVVCGPVSGICAFDYDYKFDPKRCLITEDKHQKDAQSIERSIEVLLPSSPLRKKGAVGWTVFYKNQPHFKTITADRHGVRLFDFKSSGYVVIPPSFHSEKDGERIHYKWLLGDPMDEFQDLPNLDIQIINEIKSVYGSKGLGDFNTRHGRLFLFIKAISKIEQNTDVIIEKAFQKDLDLHINDPKGPYFRDKSHTSSDPKEYCRKWIERIKVYSRDAQSNQSSPTEVIDMFDHFFEHGVKYGEPIKDILSGKIFYPHPSENRLAQGEELLPAIKCYAKEVGLKPTIVEDHFQRWQIEKTDRDFLIDIPPHDGIDYLRAHTDALSSSYYSSDEMYSIFQNWGYSLFSRVYDSNSQNRCIIIKGNQGIGKDDWIKAMVKDFRPYHVELSVNRDPIEMISAVQKSYIVHIAEFDQTKTLDVAFIKALITNSTNFYREKYARVASEKPMHASFICSVNVDDMLRDPSGNRRFVIIPLDTIDWSYHKPGLKIISQMKHNYEQGIGRTLNQDLEKKISTLSDSHTPDNMDEDIEDLFVARLNNILASRGYLKQIESNEVAHLIKEAASLFGVSTQRVYRIIKPYKYKVQGTRYYKPVKRVLS